MGRTVSNAPGCAPDDEFDPSIDDFVSKERNYIHFDLPLSEEQRTNLAFSPADIVSRSFWPLLGFTATERRVKRDRNGAITFEDKNREIKFGSHMDAALLEHYCKSLSKRYERYLAGQPFAQSVLAYRSGVGDNVSQANDLFQEIRKRTDCIAIALDISGFFDNIRHDVLLTNLGTVLGDAFLPRHDFAVFKRMTGFEWVDSDALKARLGKRYGRLGRICTAGEFRKFVRDLILINPNLYGIPQGTPLSGLYANISMAGFDSKIFRLAQESLGSYRRYSDDIALLFPSNVDAAAIIETIRSELRLIGLELSEKKTEVRAFSSTAEGQEASYPFQYLGFTFDGKRTLIRQSSLNRYYRKMRRGIRAKVRAAKEKGIPSDEIFMRELFRRYTHFGQSRNFPRYAYRAARVLRAPEIRNQLRSHMDVFKAAVRHHISEVY